MIGPIVAAVREHVAAPQEGAASPELRAYVKGAPVPLKVDAATIELYGLTTTPVRPEVGAGLLTLRHIVAVVLTVEDTDVDLAIARRDPIATQLLARAVTVDWPNVAVASPGMDQDIVSVTASVEWADVNTGVIGAYATLTLTIDTEWRL